MIALEGWARAGVPVQGPGGSVVRVRDGSGARHLAVTFRPDLVDHPMLGQGMDEVAAFVRDPGVDGVAPLVDWDRSSATFVYPAGDGILLSELIADGASRETPAGARAAMDLVAGLAPILDRAARAAREHGVPCHGALNPWRILVHPSGALSVIGYGLPPVEVAAWLDEETDRSPGIGLRYFPPERVEDEDEDVRSDLYALAACAAEVALGTPLLEANGDALVDAILDGAAAERLARVTDDVLPARVRGLLLQALSRSTVHRPSSGAQLAASVSALAATQPGPALFLLAEALSGPRSGDLMDEDTSVSYRVGTAKALMAPPQPPPEALPPDLLPRVGPLDPRLPVTPRVPDQDESDRTDVIGIPQELLDSLAGRAPALRSPIPPVDELPANASLERIRGHAGRVVERTALLAQRAAELCDKVQDKAGSEPSHASLVRRARHAADRARRAADAAGNAADLLDLDEDAAGAMITLDLVRNAELQCESATHDAAAQLKELERVAERVQAQARALAEAARRAREHANRATDAASQADDLVTRLEDAQRAGRLTAPGVVDAVDLAIAAAERAHAAGEDARAQADLASNADRADLALRYAEEARRAEEQAFTALDESKAAAEEARRVEQEALAAAVAEAEEAEVAANLAAEEARHALARADDAAGMARDPAAKRARAACEDATRAAELASSEARTATAAARSSQGAVGARKHARTALDALRRTRDAAAAAAGASDEVVRFAGAAAEVRARLSKLREEAEALLERSRVATRRAREEVDRLLEDTATLTTDGVLSARADAQSGVERAEALLPEMEDCVRAVQEAQDEADITDRLPRLRDAAVEAQRAVDDARQAVVEVRDAAEGELAEIRRQQETRRAIGQAAEEARAFAARCREQVDAAWAIARNLSDALKATEVEEAVRLRHKALEIIDIAEFQAGEAAASAEHALGESDPAEARAHAQTAQSFHERISADLPEALEALEAAEKLAQREAEAMSSARERTRAVAASIARIDQEVREAAAEARAHAAGWVSSSAVAAQIRQLESALGAFEEDLDASSWARDRAAAATTSDEAQQVVPQAASALERAATKRRRAEAILEALAKAVGAAEQDANALEDARRVVASAADAVGSDLERVQKAATRLRDAARVHEAREEGVANSLLRMRESLAAVDRASRALATLASEVGGIDDAAEARRLAEQARQHRTASERAVEAAAEAETSGVAAAEREARTRTETHQRRLEAARQDARAATQRAQAAVERVDDALDGAEDEGANAEWEPALRRFDEAVALGEALRARVGEVEQAAHDAAASERADDAERLAEDARIRAERITAESSKVLGVIQEALDLARAAAAEAVALDKVRAEVRATAERADEAVVRARTEAKRILGVLREAPRTEVRSLADAAAQHIQAATKAAAKVKAATPLAVQADTLPVAQSILKTSRLALERANAAADAVQELVERAVAKLTAEREAAARVLDEARAAAAEPAREALAAAKKAEGWLDAGRREVEEAGSTPDTMAALKALGQAVGEVGRRAEIAQAAAHAAAGAGSVEAAEQVGSNIRVAAEFALEAATQARNALDELRARIRSLQASEEAVATIAGEAAEHAMSAGQVADQAEATLRELESAVEQAGEPSPAVQRSLEAVRTAATNTRFAAARAGQAVERARVARSTADAEACADEAHKALEDALDALERVVEAEQRCRAQVEAMRAAFLQVQRQAEEQQRRLADAERRRVEDARARQEAEAEAERRRQEEERRARFERRREERVQRTRDPDLEAPRPARASGAARDRDQLRSMLRQGRPSGAPDPQAERPRRIERGNRSATAERNVASWSPSRGSSDTGSIVNPRRATRPKPERAPAEPPPLDDNDVTETGANPNPPTTDSDRVDVLLDRLRSRRLDRDD